MLGKLSGSWEHKAGHFIMEEERGRGCISGYPRQPWGVGRGKASEGPAAQGRKAGRKRKPFLMLNAGGRN